MKKKTSYIRDKRKHQWYKRTDILTWRLYLRVIKKWFTPCQECQKTLDSLWNTGYYFDPDWYKNYIFLAIRKLCQNCQKQIIKLNAESEVILGNRDYEPTIELSRTYLLVKVSEKEYSNNTK